MKQTQTISIIRDRGQLTIPDGIREHTMWVTSGSVVTVTRTGSDEIVIKPHMRDAETFNWVKLWRNIALARSYKSTSSGSLSKFIVNDRESRR